MSESQNPRHNININLIDSIINSIESIRYLFDLKESFSIWGKVEK